MTEIAGDQDPQLITEVPGVSPAGQGEAAAPDSGRFGRGVVRISEKDFRGDPSRVIGHPSNPTAEISQAYVDSLKTQEGTKQPVIELTAEELNILQGPVSDPRVAGVMAGHGMLTHNKYRIVVDGVPMEINTLPSDLGTQVRTRKP